MDCFATCFAQNLPVTLVRLSLNRCEANVPHESLREAILAVATGVAPVRRPWRMGQAPETHSLRLFPRHT